MHSVGIGEDKTNLSLLSLLPVCFSYRISLILPIFGVIVMQKNTIKTETVKALEKETEAVTFEYTEYR